MQILLTDVMFPNKYGKWRLVEIQSFIQTYKCDIVCVNRIDSYENITYSFDWDILPKYFYLEEYDLLIFNPKYNFLNKYNTTIDGTIFNNKFKADYLIRHKSRHSTDVSFDSYEAVYHIFLQCYRVFNNNIKYPQHKQFIHLYPGGGYLSPSSLDIVHKDVKLIPTQEFISRNIKHHKFINIYGGPFYYQFETVTEKNYHDGPTRVCFTSMGNPIEKGAFIYQNIVEVYKKTFPSCNTEFISIGHFPAHPSITSMAPMCQETLSKFYRDEIDVVISLDTGKSLNGFPLGVEAMQAGCVVLTTDVHNQNVLNNYRFDSFFIIDPTNINDIVNRLSLLTSKDVCLEKGKALQLHVYNLFNYDTTITKTFKFIMDNIGVCLR